MKAGKKTYLVWFVLLFILGFGVYYRGLGISYYGDDFKFVFTESSSKIFYYWTHENPNLSWYRPIEASFLALVQTYAGLNTFPIHITQVFLHILLAWLVFVAIRGLEFSFIQAALSSLYVLVCQINVLPVLSNDTMSQVLGVLFGCIGLWFYNKSLATSEKVADIPVNHNSLDYVFSIVAFAVSMFSKESSVVFLFSMVVLGVYQSVKNKSLILLRKRVMSLVPFLSIAVFYFLLRTNIVHRATSERYDVLLGTNILKNFAMSLFGALVPASSVTAFEALATREYVTLGVILVLTVCLTVFVIVGLWKAQHKEIIVQLLIVSFANLFPLMLIKHVSELYIYISIPFIGILVGIGLGYFVEKFYLGQVRRVLFYVLIAWLGFVHIAAIQSKAQHMDENGERASELLRQIVPFVEKIPKDATLLLVNQEEGKPEYSVFEMSGFNVLNYGLHRIQQIANRKDILVKIVRYEEIGEYRGCRDCVALILKENNVRQANMDQLL